MVSNGSCTIGTENKKKYRDVICISTSNPSSTLSPGSGGGSLIVICPHTGSIHSSLRVSGDILSNHNNASSSKKGLLGLDSLSFFPRSFSGGGSSYAMGYGGNISTSKNNNGKKKNSNNYNNDTFAMLLSTRNMWSASATSSTSSSTIHWKCRLPESDFSAGLKVSPCGHYIIGGAVSGNLYVWLSVGGGTLIRSFKAHYRSVNVLLFSSCGRFVISGGDDGMVHVFALMDLVERGNNKNNTGKVAPYRTLSTHRLAVTALALIDNDGMGDRIVSASEDALLVIMELFSGAIIAKIQLPQPIQALTCHNNRLYAASSSSSSSNSHGTIYLIDLDIYAMLQTSQGQQSAGGSAVAVQERNIPSIDDFVFGNNKNGNDNHDVSSSKKEDFKMELRGHERAVTALTVLADKEDGQEWLISGDEIGTIRVWDLQTRTCVRIIRPWSLSAAETNTTTNTNTDSSPTMASTSLHPVTSIQTFYQKDFCGNRIQSSNRSSSNFGNLTRPHSVKEGQSTSSSIVSLLTPLHKFLAAESDSGGSTDTNSILWTNVPFLRPYHSNFEFWHVSSSSSPCRNHITFATKRQRLDTSTSLGTQKDNNDMEISEKEGSNSGHNNDEDNNGLLLKKKDEKIQILQKELEESKSIIQRWENVNNKLMTKLNKKKKSSA